MSVHVRTRIRRAVKSLLGDLECAHGNVFVGLSWPTDESKLPCLVIATPTEQALDETMGDGRATSRRKARTVTVKIWGRVSGSEDEAILDQLDEMARQVEDKLDAEVHADSGALDALVLAVHHVGTVTQPIETADTKKGVIEITYAMEYATTAGNAAAALV